MKRKSFAARDKPSLCFVAPQAYPVLDGDPNLKVVGGSEVQQCILAREFVRRGHRVSMVCLDYGQPPSCQIDGITVIRSHRQGAGLPKLRTAWALVNYWRAMARADADVYYQQNCSVLTGYVAAFSRVHRRRAIYCGASDLDFVATAPLLLSARDRAIYLWGLRRMDAIVVQSERQAQTCLRDFKLPSLVIRSCYGHHGAPGDRGGVLLWSGRITPAKAPELFVDLARQCPEFQFRMVGGGQPEYFESIRARANGLSNIEFIGFVPYNQVEPMFDGIAAVINTSPSEGFPNTFLQGWARGVPTVSFFDPDCALDGRPVGIVVKTMEEMAAAVMRLKRDATVWARHSTDALNYFQQQFTLDKVADDYEALFESLAAGRPVSGAEDGRR